MLGVGYLSGVDQVPDIAGNPVNQFVVNAAINHGNSGGPVILVETGEVIGVADNKIAPLSDESLAALAALQGASYGMQYPATMPDGSTKSFGEGQVVAMVLEQLRQQVQLAIGHTVLLDDIRAFLSLHGIAP